jgi:hypothetical protein
VRLVLATALVVAAAPGPVSAYETLGASWRLDSFPSGVSYCPVVNAKDATTTTTRNQFLAALNAAATAWSNHATLGAPCSALPIQNATGLAACSGSPTYGSDKPWVYWEDAWSTIPGVGSSTIGLTPFYTVGSEITEAKIVFNDRDYNWDTSASDTDVQSIAVHEFGHFFGLDHYDEYSATKRTQCQGAFYPSVMCSMYPGGATRTLSADDVQGICYLYPKPGALGSSCSSSACGSGLSCHPDDDYCTKSCGTCPAGYTCTGGLCERNVPPPTCPSCGDLGCGAGSYCMGYSGGSFCTRDCSGANPCPSDFDCSPLEGGGSVCWPLSNSCSTTGPGPGEACTSEGECALGNICLDDGTTNGNCFELCQSATECTSGQECFELDADISYCADEQTCPVCGALPCDEAAICLETNDGEGMCAPECSNNIDCPLGFYCADLTGGGGACYPVSNSCAGVGPGAGQACNSGDVCRLGAMCLDDGSLRGTCFTVCRDDGDCPSDRECFPTSEVGVGYCDDPSGGCSCDTSSGACDAGCFCDVDCDATGSCVCDVDTECSRGCPCDPECGECGCDINRGCDANCDCDPMCSCDCDTTFECDSDCACDVECLCLCDTTYECDAECAECDPECQDGGCFSAAVSPGELGSLSGAWGALLGLVALARVRVRRSAHR